MTFAMMTRGDIKAQGVVSVIANVVPGALTEMTAALNRGDMARGEELAQALDPLFKIVTVKTVEEYEGFQVPCKFRNPSAIKTLMRGLGMPAGPCRPPLGRMTPKGTAVVRDAVRTVYENSSEVLTPIADFYKVDLEERIYQDEHWL
jgi:4-hydroxy-tetrahydrodipicolinate synthase